MKYHIYLSNNTDEECHKVIKKIHGKSLEVNNNYLHISHIASMVL
jgi:hypothetical protein